MAEGPRRSVLPVVVAGTVLIGAMLWWAGRERRAPVSAQPPPVPLASRTGADPAREAPVGGATSSDASDSFELPETPWAEVDLERVRNAMPDNLFWKMGMPTRDPEVLRMREEERERWNVEYGKVLSNTATAEEVDAYYAQRQKLSTDYVEFATFVLAEYGDRLSTRDVGLLKVAIELNLARLEEIPRQIAEAHERRKAHDAARRAWLEQQAAFDATNSR